MEIGDQSKKKFDPSTAKIFDPSTAQVFDPSTATPVDATQTQGMTIGKNFSEPFNAAGEQFRQGQAKMDAGSYVAGGAQKVNALAQGLFSPVAGIDQTLRQGAEAHGAFGTDVGIPAILTALGLIPKAANWAGETLGKSMLGYQGLMLGHNLGTSPENAQQIRKEVPAAMGTVGSVVLPFAGAKAVSAVAPKIGEMVDTQRINKATTEIKQVAPPTPKELNYDQSLKRAEPYIAEQQRLTPIDMRAKVSPVRQATDLVAEAKDRLWTDKVQPQVESLAQTGATIDGRAIAKQVSASISPYVKNHLPEMAAKIEQYAQTFNRDIPIADANGFIAELNARTRAYQKASPIEQTAMEGSRPSIGAEVTAVEGLRDAVYSKLEDAGFQNARELRRDYGALAQIHQALQRKIVSAERGGPGSGSFYGKPFGTAVATAATLEGMANAPMTTLAAGGTGLIRRILLDRGKANPTINRAFNRLGNSSLQTPAPSVEPISPLPATTPIPPTQGFTPPPGSAANWSYGDWLRYITTGQGPQ